MVYRQELSVARQRNLAECHARSTPVAAESDTSASACLPDVEKRLPPMYPEAIQCGICVETFTQVIVGQWVVHLRADASSPYSCQSDQSYPCQWRPAGLWPGMFWKPVIQIVLRRRLFAGNVRLALMQ